MTGRSTLCRIFVVFLATLLLGGCIQRDRQEHVEYVEESPPDWHAMNLRMPRTVGVDQAKRMLDTDENLVLVDVRDGQAWSAAMIKGAIHLPERLVAANAVRELPDQDTRLLLYSIPGRGSIMASATLRELGYRNVGRLHGTWEQWKEAGLPIGVPVTQSRFLNIDDDVDVDVKLDPDELPFPEEVPDLPDPLQVEVPEPDKQAAPGDIQA